MAHSSIKRLLVGLTGGIAAYKAAELVRLLVRQGVDVQVVMTQAACQFITPVTLQALSGKPVFTDLWDDRIDNGMAHIEFSRDADAILIAPASADFMARLAQGRADDLLSTICLARGGCPLMVAPAMNVQMWENAATQRNVKQLRADSVHILGPDSGDQACGDTGLGRMLEPEDMLDAICRDGYRQVLVAPIGFICDHVETLFDIDIELRQVAVNKGMQLARMAMLNDSPALLQTLHNVLASHESSSCISS